MNANALAWQLADNPEWMLDVLMGCPNPDSTHLAPYLPPDQRPSARKLRLFAVACLRLVHTTLNPPSLEAITEAEAVADLGYFTPRAMALADETATGALTETPGKHSVQYARQRGGSTPVMANLAREIFPNPFLQAPIGLESKVIPQGDLGVTLGPRPSTGHPVRFLSPTAFELASAAYLTGDWELLFPLSDLVEEAGVTDEHLLRHLRGEGQVLCGRCGGKKGSYEYPSDDPTNRYMSGSHWYECYECEGTGLCWQPLPVNHHKGCWAVDYLLGKK